MGTVELSEIELEVVEHFGIHRDQSLSPTIVLVAAADRVESAAEAVRARLAPAPTEGMIKTPDEMIDDLEWAKHGSGQIALTLKIASLAVREAQQRFGRAHALAIRSSDGRSAEQREADALLSCQGEQLALDAALTAQEYAKHVARAIEQTGSMTQTQASLVKAQMNLAGSGRGA